MKLDILSATIGNNSVNSWDSSGMAVQPYNLEQAFNQDCSNLPQYAPCETPNRLATPCELVNNSNNPIAGSTSNACGTTVGNAWGQGYMTTNLNDWNTFHNVLDEWASWSGTIMIRDFEGFAAKPYVDNGVGYGTCTLGYGHVYELYQTCEQLGIPCVEQSVATVNAMFIQDIFAKDRSLHGMLEAAGIKDLTQYQFDTLSFLNFNFNLPSATLNLISDYVSNNRVLTNTEFDQILNYNLLRATAAAELWFNHMYTHGT